MGSVYDVPVYAYIIEYKASAGALRSRFRPLLHTHIRRTMATKHPSLALSRPMTHRRPLPPGVQPIDGQEVVFNYVAYNESGGKIDSSYRQGRPGQTRLGINGLIPGEFASLVVSTLFQPRFF